MFLATIYSNCINDKNLACIERSTLNELSLRFRKLSMEGSEATSQAGLCSLNGCKDLEDDCHHVQKKRHVMEAPPHSQSQSGPLMSIIEKGVQQFASRKETIDIQVVAYA